jgi:hypothetical protein
VVNGARNIKKLLIVIDQGGFLKNNIVNMEERKQPNENKMNYIPFYYPETILQEECRASRDFRQLQKHILIVWRIMKKQLRSHIN